MQKSHPAVVQRRTVLQKKNEQTGSSSKAESSKTKSRSTENEDIPISDTIEE